MAVKGLNRIASSPAVLPPAPSETTRAPERIEVIPSREYSQRIGQTTLGLESVKNYLKSLDKFNDSFDDLNATAARKASEFKNSF